MINTKMIVIGVLFFLVANPRTYKLVNNLLSQVGLKGMIFSGGCVSPTGVVIHAAIFTMLFCFLFSCVIEEGFIEGIFDLELSKLKQILKKELVDKKVTEETKEIKDAYDSISKETTINKDNETKIIEDLNIILEYAKKNNRGLEKVISEFLTKTAAAEDKPKETAQIFVREEELQQTYDDGPGALMGPGSDIPEVIPRLNDEEYAAAMAELAKCRRIKDILN